MPQAAIIWSIKSRSVAGGPYPNERDAKDALRKHLSQSGTSLNDKQDAESPADYEIVAVTI